MARRSLVLITVSRFAQEAARRLEELAPRGYRLARIVLLDGSGAASAGVPVSPLCGETLARICRDWVDEAFILLPQDERFPDELADWLVSVGILVSYPASASARAGRSGKTRGQGPAAVRTESLFSARAWQLAVKRAADIAGGLVGCAATGLLCLFIAPVLYLADPGPVFFAQRRVGKGGRRITIHKFRTMYRDAEARQEELMGRNEMSPAPMFKLADDPRVIGSQRRDARGRPRGIGNFLRRASLDEFPQFFDCLTGKMSLVGWRPCTLPEWEAYRPEHRVRACVKPGITGPWQVSGRNRITDFDEVIRLERDYIEHWTLRRDFIILLKTVPAVLSGDGAQ